MAVKVMTGTKLVVDAVKEGSRNDGTPWQRVFIKSDDGKTKFDFFVEEFVENLREGDTVEVTEAAMKFTRRKKTDYEINTEWLTFCSPLIKLKIVDGGGFGNAPMPDKGFGEGGFGGGGFGSAGFDVNEGELPF